MPYKISDFDCNGGFVGNFSYKFKKISSEDCVFGTESNASARDNEGDANSRVAKVLERVSEELFFLRI